MSRVAKWFFSPIAYNIWEDLSKNASDWTTTEYRFVHKTGISLWIANGSWFCNAYSDPEGRPGRELRTLGYLERHFIYWQVKKIFKQENKKLKKEAVDQILNAFNLSLRKNKRM